MKLEEKLLEQYFDVIEKKFVDGFGMAFKSSSFKHADVAPDYGFATVVVPVNSSEHFSTVAVNDYL